MNSNKKINEYLSKLKKEELIDLVNHFHMLCEVNDFHKAIEIEKEKKEFILDYLVDLYSKYVKFFISSLDNEDYNLLKKIIKKSSILSIDNKFLKYLNDSKILFANEMPKETKSLIKKYINNKKIVKDIRNNEKYYNIAKGIILAYGVIDINRFKELIGSYKYYLLISNYYKKDYIIQNDRVVSNKLSNKKKINKYYKDKDIKEFSKKDYLNLGKNIYHHDIKSYKKLIKILKKNYIFKNYDIIFVDKMIVTPYLYNSLSDEKLARENLEQAIDNYFEFHNQKLKDMMLNNIIKIKKEFPLWEYRGKSSSEVR